MTRLQARLIIFADEWLWIGILAWLHRRGDPWWLQAAVFVAGAVANWCIAYPAHWREFATTTTTEGR